MSKSEAARRLGARTAIEIATASLGLAGPVGALAAAAIKPALELVAVREEQGMHNIKQVVTGVQEATGLSPDEFGQWASKSDGRLMLATSAFQAANNTLHERKVKALAAVLADNINDVATLDLSTVIVAALADLEAPHIRILHAMININSRAPYQHDGLPDNSWLESGFEIHFPGLRSGLIPILATLDRWGLAARGPDVPGYADKKEPTWHPTSFGFVCLRYLEKPE